jgi:mono/diheme cytochrome c family protein
MRGRNRLLSLACAAATVLGAQHMASVRDGVYSAAQAEAGEALYAKNCASCHGKALEGQGQAPPLTGSEFLVNWNGATVGELFEKMQTSMPADRPGALKIEETASILAFMLSTGKFPAGSSALATDAGKLKQIRFEPAKGK